MLLNTGDLVLDQFIRMVTSTLTPIAESVTRFECKMFFDLYSASFTKIVPNKSMALTPLYNGYWVKRIVGKS